MTAPRAVRYLAVGLLAVLILALAQTAGQRLLWGHNQYERLGFAAVNVAVAATLTRKYVRARDTYLHQHYRSGPYEIIALAAASRPAYEPASIVCPACGWRSYSPSDIREGYCGHCHDWTGRT